MGVAVILSEQSFRVEPGGEATIDVAVTNSGTVVDQFHLDVIGEAAAWSVVEPAAVALMPGRTDHVMVRFRPPRSSDRHAGVVPFAIRAASHEDPQGTSVEEGQVEVGTFRELSAELAPRMSHGRLAGRHDIALDNRGNTGVSARLRATDPTRTLRFRFQPPVVTVGPGQAGFTRVRVAPHARFLTGPPKTKSFSVVIEPETEEPIVVDGGFLHEALLPSWWRVAAVALAAGVAALVLAWFLLLRPAVVSTAKDAVGAEQGQQATDIANLKKQADDTNKKVQALQPAGGGSSGSGQGSTPTPPPSLPATGVTELGTPFDRRLAVQTGTSYVVPQNSTLSATDLVFENPDGNTGTATLERVSNGQVSILLSMNLANYRDLDYHFVTPITLGAGQKLQYACVSSCGTSGVYVSGFLKGS